MELNKISSIGHALADVAVNAIKERMLSQKLAAVVAVSDVGGETIALWKHDLAPSSSIWIATSKAWTAARLRMTSGQLGRDARDPVNGFDMAFLGDSRYVGWGGGIPIKVDEVTVGAIGVSGLSSELDEELAICGREAILHALGH